MEKENKNQSNNTCDSLMEKKEIDKVDLSELKIKEEIDPENNFNVNVKRNEKGELIYISMWKKDIVISNIFKDKDD